MLGIRGTDRIESARVLVLPIRTVTIETAIRSGAIEAGTDNQNFLSVYSLLEMRSDKGIEKPVFHTYQCFGYASADRVPVYMRTP